MKKYNYKIVLYARGTYREYSLSEKFHQKLTIGTMQTSDVRFNQKEYPEKFEVTFSREGNVWSVNCTDEIKLEKNENEKKAMEHGFSDTILTKEGKLLFSFIFIMEYPDKHVEFDSYVDIKGREKVTIGDRKDADIFIPDLEGDYIRITRNTKGISVVNKSQNGVYINGFPQFDEIITIHNYEFIMMDGYEFYLDGDKLFYSMMENMDIRINKERVISRKEYPHFVRNTRFQSVIPDEKIMVLSPKPKMEQQKRSILFTIIPTLFAMVIMVVLRSMMGRNGLFAIYGAVTMGIGVITSVVTHFADTKEYRQNEKERRESYMKYISKREDYIREMRKKELDIRNKKFISLRECIDEVNLFDSKLFEKNKQDDDFLTIRLGKGKIPAACKIDYKTEDFKDNDGDLMEYPSMLAQTYKYLNDAPVCVDLKALNGLGVVGNSVQNYEFLKVITFDLAVRHHYKDVRFVYFLESGEEERYQWLRWLKNVEYGGKREFVYDEESRKHILETLYEQFSFRESLGKDELKNLPNIVVFVQGEQCLEKHPIINYISRCNELGFTFCFFNDTKEKLPLGCDYVVIAKNAGEATLVNTRNTEDVVDFSYETVPDKVAGELALRLGSIYMDEISLESGLVKNITLYELLDIVNADNLNLAKRWNDSKIYDSMAAPLGVDSSGHMVQLDLHEKFHGPHGLVAGTTGSGKSEILLSYILSMATLFHPHEVGFVIIDFKGGGMVNQLAKLPHLIGAITNLEGNEIQRSLMSIQAELKKRQQLFAEQQVNHIDAYIKKYKSGEAKIALPHLILIVDEFAELKSSQPEFMDELISTARIGRSLGVHLILATQKPSGVVNEQIWSNSKFKLCLKVQNKTDSNDVIKSPLAAEIREPGRAYLQVGNNEIFKLFQSAYSGASSVINEVGTIKEYTVYEKALSGEHEIIYQQKSKKQKDEKVPTQLEAIVDFISDYCDAHQIQRLPGICLPMLDDVIEYEETEDTNDFSIALGKYDDPANQYQGIYRVNVCQENTIIIGASQYGKTNLLQLMIQQLAEHYSPKEVQLYILDFASATLKIYESLRHVGGVVLASEDEKMENFFKLMNEQIEIRKERLSDMGLGSFSAYKEAGGTEFANVVIFVDNLVAMRELYLMENDPMLRIIREGLSVGITVVVANSQSNGIPFRYLSNFSNRIALYCNEKSEYSFLFERVSASLEDVPGRAFISLEKRMLQAQIFLTSSEEREIDRVNATRKMIEKVNERYDTKAMRIPVVPKVLFWDNFVKEFMPEKTVSMFAPGLSFDNVEPMYMRMQVLSILGISGADFAMTENYTVYALKYIQTCMKKNLSSIYVFGNSMEAIKDGVDDEGIQIVQTTDVSELEEIITSFEDDFEKDVFVEQPVVIVINGERFVERLAENKDLDKRFCAILEKMTRQKQNFVLYNAFPNERISRSAPQIHQLIKEQGGMVVFDEVDEVRVIDILPSAIRKFKKKLMKWEAYYIEGINIAKIKTVKVK